MDPQRPLTHRAAGAGTRSWRRSDDQEKGGAVSRPRFLALDVDGRRVVEQPIHSLTGDGNRSRLYVEG